MDKQAFLNKIAEIGTCEDDVARRTLLTELSDEATPIFDDLNSLTEQNNNLTTDNETLRKANMKLFLQVEEQKTQDDDPMPGPPKEKRKFENLFNEKGEIK
jgi:regulator of replication initiation timing